MRRRFGMASAGLALWTWTASISGPLAGQSAPRTPWGDPDLEGIWSYATITPLERTHVRGPWTSR